MSLGLPFGWKLVFGLESGVRIGWLRLAVLFFLCIVSYNQDLSIKFIDGTFKYIGACGFWGGAELETFTKYYFFIGVEICPG